MGSIRAKSILVPSDLITVYFATTNIRANKIAKRGFREGVSIQVTDSAVSPGVFDRAESCFEITLPESTIAEYEQKQILRVAFLRNGKPVEFPRKWNIPTEIVNRHSKVRLDMGYSE